MRSRFSLGTRKKSAHMRTTHDENISARVRPQDEL